MADATKTLIIPDKPTKKCIVAPKPTKTITLPAEV